MRFVRVALDARGLRVMTGVGHLIAVHAVRMLRRIDRMLMHAQRVRMRTRGAVVSTAASQHRCGSKALDGDRQGQLEL